MAGVFVERQGGAMGEVRSQQADVAELAVGHLAEEGEGAPGLRDAGRPTQGASDDRAKAGAATGRRRAFEHRPLLAAKALPLAAEASALGRRAVVTRPAWQEVTDWSNKCFFDNR